MALSMHCQAKALLLWSTMSEFERDLEWPQSQRFSKPNGVYLTEHTSFRSLIPAPAPTFDGVFAYHSSLFPLDVQPSHTNQTHPQ